MFAKYSDEERDATLVFLTALYKDMLKEEVDVAARAFVKDILSKLHESQEFECEVTLFRKVADRKLDNPRKPSKIWPIFEIMRKRAIAYFQKHYSAQSYVLEFIGNMYPILKKPQIVMLNLENIDECKSDTQNTEETWSILMFLRSEGLSCILLTTVLSICGGYAMDSRHLLLIATPLFLGTIVFVYLTNKPINVKAMPFYTFITAFFLVVALFSEKISDTQVQCGLLIAASLFYYFAMHFYLKISASINDWMLTFIMTTANLVLIASLYCLMIIIYRNPISITVVVPCLVLGAIVLSWCRGRGLQKTAKA